LRRRRSGYLRQVGDAKNLMLCRKFSHLGSNGIRDLSAHIRVDLVENQKRNRVVGRERGFDREHEPRNFTARCYCAQRLQRFSGIRREQQLNGIEPAWPRFIERDQIRFEFRLLKPEIAQIRADVIGQLRRRFAPRLVQRVSNPLDFAARAFDFAPQALQLRIAPLDFPEPFLRSLAKCDRVGDRSTIFAFQTFEEIHPFFQCRKLGRIEIELLRIMSEGPRNLRELDDAASSSTP